MTKDEIIFELRDGRVGFYEYGITNGVRTIPCNSLQRAEDMLKRSIYADYYVISSKEVSSVIEKAVKNQWFKDYNEADEFLNGGGYVESLLQRVEDLEITQAELLFGGGTDE